MATAAWINYRDDLKYYKAYGIFTLYSEVMTSTGDLRVSQRGQMSLPASARHRWGLDEGGEVGYLDIGDAVILVPGGEEASTRASGGDLGRGLEERPFRVW